MWVSLWVSGSHKKFVNSKILIESINDLWYGYIVYDEVRYCPILHDIVNYYPVSSNIFQYCVILLEIGRFILIVLDTVLYCSIDILQFNIVQLIF